MTKHFYETTIKPVVDKIELFVKEHSNDPEEFVVDTLCVELAKNEFDIEALKKLLTGATPLERRVLLKNGIDLEGLLEQINKMDT